MVNSSLKEFKPPVFSILRAVTFNLDIKMSDLWKRYKIIDEKESNESSSKKQSSLELLIARTNKVIQCDTDRISARDVFAKLVDDLRQIPSENINEIKQGTMFLLGALIHRYFRMIKSHEEKSFSLWKWNPTSSTLFQSIREALQFNVNLKTDFEKDDLKKLDVITIVSCLEVFRDNMLLDDRYKKFPHFANDSNFKKYLQNIIDQYSIIGAPNLNQFYAIQFLQSLTTELDIELKIVEEALDKWAKKLEEDFFNCSDLDIKQIEDHIEKNITSIREKNVILDLLYTDNIKKDLKKMENLKALIAAFKKCHSFIATFTLFGGYVLVLRSKDTDKNLRAFLNEALGVKDNPDIITVKDMLNGVRFLQEFVTNNTNIKLECKFFSDKETTYQVITKTELNLTELQQKQIKEDIEKKELTQTDLIF